MGRPGWDHRGLPCEPGRCLCQDIALLAQLPVLTPQTGQLLALGAGRAVLSAAFVAIGLTNPVPDRLGGRFELARQRLRCSPRSDQINHLSAEFRRIGPVTLRHRWHLLLKWKGIHQTGSTPPRRSASARIGPCGEYGLTLMAVVLFHGWMSRSRAAAASAPAKFGIRPCGGNGKRATPSALSLSQTHCRAALLSAKSRAMTESGAARPR